MRRYFGLTALLITFVALLMMFLPTWTMVFAGGPDQRIPKQFAWHDALLVGYGSYGPGLGLMCCVLGLIWLAADVANQKHGRFAPIALALAAVFPVLNTVIAGGASHPAPAGWAIPALCLVAAGLTWARRIASQRDHGPVRVPA